MERAQAIAEAAARAVVATVTDRPAEPEPKPEPKPEPEPETEPPAEEEDIGVEQAQQNLEVVINGADELEELEDFEIPSGDRPAWRKRARKRWQLRRELNQFLAEEQVVAMQLQEDDLELFMALTAQYTAFIVGYSAAQGNARMMEIINRINQP